METENTCTIECCVCFATVTFRVPDDLDEALYVELGVTDDPGLLEAEGWIELDDRMYCPAHIPEPPAP
jgi:hypothetical protein